MWSRSPLALALVLVLVPAATSQAELPTYSVQYGRLEKDFAIVHPAPGGVPLLLLHEAGLHTPSTEAIAFGIQRERLFTVINLEWEELKARAIWEYDVGQVEEAVRYVQAHAAELGVDPGRLEMLGGSRGANLSLLTSEPMNSALPGTVKAVVALSADVNPMNQIRRAEAGELSSGIAGKLSNV